MGKISRGKLIVGAALASFLLPACGYAAPPAIVDNGKSTFTIALPENAPSSIQAAAQELQKNIEISTGAKLPIIAGSDAKSPAISLGNTDLAKNAGISTKNIALEGFRIVTKGDDIYIIGPDTADGTYTENSGTSNGTANGTYTFLEDYLGVRWLMPGDIGRDVPHKSTFVVDDIDRTEAPAFINRREPYIQNNLPAVRRWQNHQKLGYSFRISHAHNWRPTVPASLYQDHPDWFAMIGGKRVPPTGRYKLETTNPELVEHFANKAVERLKKYPHEGTFSLSPSDSGGWSESPESEKLKEPSPSTVHDAESSQKSTSVTPLILKFYRDVSEAVAKKDSSARLAGYIYSNYLYPPRDGNMTLPDNFYPVIAPSIDYGFTLYRPDVQHDFDALMRGWSKVTPNLFFYDLFNQLTSASGIVMPPATEILNFAFPRLTQSKVKGVYIYGSGAWGQAAMGNYILAKMMWNSELDAAQLQKEWLSRAYGDAAGKALEPFYDKLDAVFRDYYQNNNKASYTLTADIEKNLYGVNYPELERLFLTAKSQPMTAEQQKRWNLLEENMIVLQWRLRTTNSLNADYQSALTRDDDEVIEILTQDSSDYGFELFPGMIDQGPTIKPATVEIASSVGESPKTISVSMRNASQTLLYSEKGGQVSINPTRVSHGRPFVAYTIKDAKDNVVKTGVFVRREKIEFSAQPKTPYYLYINSGIYVFDVKGAAVALRNDMGSGGRMHLFANPATLYINVPAGVKNWQLTLASDIPGETAKVNVFSPSGANVGELVTVTEPAQVKTFDGEAGIWKIVLEKADKGVLDDVYLQFDKSIPKWVNLDPSRPLVIKE